MKKLLKWIAIIIAAPLVIAIALPFLINVNSFRPQIESSLTDALGRKVTVGNLSLSILSGSVGADDIAIADDPAFASTPFIRAKALKVGVEMMPLIFSKQLHVTELTLDEPQVVLLRAPSGRWNYSTLGGNAASKPTTAYFVRQLTPAKPFGRQARHQERPGLYCPNQGSRQSPRVRQGKYLGQRFLLHLAISIHFERRTSRWRNSKA